MNFDKKGPKSAKPPPPPLTAADLEKIITNTKLSYASFARLIGSTPRTLLRWKSVPFPNLPKPVELLVRLIDRYPDLVHVLESLHGRSARISDRKATAAGLPLAHKPAPGRAAWRTKKNQSD